MYICIYIYMYIYIQSEKSFMSSIDMIGMPPWLHVYLVFIELIGLSKDLAVLNCKVLKKKSPYAVSGVYWIDPDGVSRSNAFQVYCDQKTDGGGWTLVYSYTFTGRAETLSPRAHLGQLATLTFECLKQFHWAWHSMRPWTFLCGAALARNSWSRATSTTGSHARKVLVA